MREAALKFAAAVPPTIFFIEVFVRLKVVDLAKNLMGSMNESLRTISESKFSDQQKQSILLRNSLIIFLKTIQLFLFILGICVGASALFVLEARAIYGEWVVPGWVLSIEGFVYCCIIGVIYSFFRRRFNGKLFTN